ncbi:ExeM/NucH family extracellular endonuclease [Aeromicrobium chenweiae]|uniref:Glutamate--cysteine ligase n=1 Tax=Aeromicrobium chenweiae TaxID=2079793 RepID=A0A2S0WPG3_9ACTN|nr:ExeM/NucH family extracellular endonuclease [Aeromicrobium chenweiae]AWB93228.1 glutamate--cysteine ligase [Aeromicrobium chenweiae]TGN34220.1 ExeM/NucH family extracellular endonuclease [Aeromicrobium chenweiae]
MLTSIVTRWAAAAAVSVASLVAVPVASATAAPAGDTLVINEIYNNGGSTGASYANRFFELHNPTDHDISVNGWSLQYKSATGAAFTGKTELGDKHLEPGGTLVVRGASNNAATSPGAAVPADVTPETGLNSAGGSGVVALSRSTATLTTSLTDANLVDLVGYGTTANLFEGTARAVTGGLTSSINRKVAGQDSDDNAADFATGAPSPTACGAACDGPGDSGGGPVDPPADPVDATISEIQGAGAASPLVGTTVTTRGVVTAVYATGGFNGAYIQTPGTGGAIDLAGHTASDGVFVHGSAFAAGVEKGDLVEVTGPVSEFNGLTELTTTAGGFSRLSEAHEPVAPATVSFPLSEKQRESLEGMLLLPQSVMTVTDNYATNQYGEIGLADGTQPLQTPTNVVAPGDPAKALLAENQQRLVNLDDGASINFLSAANQGIAMPWLRPDNEVRVGAAVTFVDPVVLDWRNNVWKLQPTQHLTSTGKEPVTFSATRTAAPAAVGGDVRIGTFNVLNYFSTTAADFEKAGLGTCTTYKDRAGNPVTANTCTNNGPRGAAEDDDLARQQTKIVTAINTLDADVVSLEEIENSRSVDPAADRDEALSTLVDALNAAAGEKRWAFVPSPSTLPASEDVIRTAFIYQLEVVSTVGASSILDDPAFANARQPLAQAFRPTGGSAASTFAVIVNHFKSKGSGSGQDSDQGDGQGASNHSRVLQATALVAFADRFGTSAGTDKVFLTGDFNAYNKEDPVRIIEEAGYTNVPAKRTNKETYQFDGMVGSLDHVFASAAAYERVTGADIWNINAYEALAREYSRHNYNATDLYTADPYRASDHDPELVGFTATPDAAGSTTTATAPASIRAGKDLTVAVTVGGGTTRATGTVTVSEDGDPIATGTLTNGEADVVVPGLSIGTHSLTVSYGGDAEHAASSATVTTQVLRATSGLSATVGAATYGTSATLTVTGEKGSSGFVYVAAGDDLVGLGTLADGTARVALSSTLPVGRTQLTVFYAGNDDFDPGSATVTITVAKAATTIRRTAVTPSRIVKNRTKPFVELSVTGKGFTVDGGTVTVRASGKSYTGTVRKGAVRIRIGTFSSSGPAKKVTATFSGNGVAKASSTSFTVKVRKK